MAYIFSKTPERPSNPKCPAEGQYGSTGHAPLEILGTGLDSFGQELSCDDGGVVIVWPCRKCGLMYYRALTMSERIPYEIKREGQISKQSLKDRVLGMSVVTLERTLPDFLYVIKTLIDAGTIKELIENNSPHYVWNKR